MKGIYNFIFNKSRKKPMCNTCKYRKRGLTTICQHYKRIPPGVQHGEYCGKYEDGEYCGKYEGE